jgi:hypothetical protein
MDTMCNTYVTTWFNRVQMRDEQAMRDKHIKKCVTCKRLIHFRLQQYARNDLASRQAHRNADEAFRTIMSSSINVYIEDLRWHPVEVEMILPPDIRDIIKLHLATCSDCRNHFLHSRDAYRRHTQFAFTSMIIYMWMIRAIKSLAILMIPAFLIAIISGLQLANLTFDYNAPGHSIGKDATTLQGNANYLKEIILANALTFTFILACIVLIVIPFIILIIAFNLPYEVPLPRAIRFRRKYNEGEFDEAAL